MKRVLILGLVMGLTLAACGKTDLNPLRWLSKARKGAVVETFVPPADPRGLMDKVVGLQIEPVRTGVLVRATGMPPTQGFWDAALVPLPNDGSGQLVFEFRVFAPTVAASAGTTATRQITAVASVTNFDLTGVTSIEVKGSQNAMSAQP